MEKRDLQIDLELDLKLFKIGACNIDLKFKFMQCATIEQKKDLLAFIIYFIANNHFSSYHIISTDVIHDMKGILSNDPHFLPKSYGYNKTILITKL